MTDDSDSALRDVSGAPAAAMPKPHEGVIFVALILTQFVATAGVTVLYMLLTGLHREYAGGSIDMGWAVTAYLFVAASAGAVCGKLGDVYGRRPVTLCVLVAAATGAVVSMLVPSALGVVLGCALQGVAGALTPLSMGLARDHLPMQRIPLAIGAISASGSGGAALIFVATGWVMDHFESHGAFLMKLLLAVIAFVALLVAIPRRPTYSSGDKPADDERIGFVRGLLFMPPLAALLIAIDRAAVWGLGDPRLLVLLAFGAFGLFAWGADQRRQSRPLIDLDLFRGRAMILPLVVTFLHGAAVIQYGPIFAQLLQQPTATGAGFALSASVAGLFMAVLNGTAVITSPLAGKVMQKIGPRMTGIIGAVIGIAGWGTIAFDHHSLALVAIFGVIVIAALGFLFTACFGLLVAASPLERVGEATGIGYVVLSLSMAIGSQFIFTTLAQWPAVDPASGDTYPADMAWTMVLLGTTFASALIIPVLCALPRGDRTLVRRPA